MILYPTIELMRGRCVSLRRGRFDSAVGWNQDPVDVALGFARVGAPAMQITDLDAIGGESQNQSVIAEIIRKVGIPVQVAGGFRTQDRIEQAMELGAARIVMGTVATRHPDWMRAMAKYYPDQIVLSVDVSKGRVMVDGWREPCVISPDTLIGAFADAPLAAVKITDIDNSIGSTDGSIGVISNLAKSARAPVIASGVVHTLEDVSRLKYIPNIAGALVGRAIVQGRIDLGEALDLAAEVNEPVAAFV
jgi:phosphoribosylformimino-5-aminoimidazole carboxamide ribotide isomerase